MRRFRYVIADVFTDEPLAGNQVAVFTDGATYEEDMQLIARETNLSETVFVLPATTDNADVRIRIFTPAVELPFAGHPTLGARSCSAGRSQKIVIRIETGFGRRARRARTRRPEDRVRRMEQPVPTWEVEPNPEPIFAALGVAGSEPARRALRPRAWPRLHRARLAGGGQGLRPDIVALARTTGDGVNCFAHVAGPRWKTRMFAPGHGVGEDPRPAPRPVRSRSTSPATDGSPFGEQIEISQGAEIERPSTLYAQVEGEGDRIDRVASAVRPCSSPAASSASELRRASISGSSTATAVQNTPPSRVR